NIPAVQNAFKVGCEEAEQYLPFGCGEYVIDHISIGSPNNFLNMMNALMAVLHNGWDVRNNRPIGLKTGDLAEFDTFDKLFDAYKKQIEHYTKAMAIRHAYEYKLERETAAFLYCSMLFDDCMERGRSI